MEMSPAKNISNRRAASPIIVLAITVAVIAAVLASLLLVAAPAGAAGVGSTTMSADDTEYKVAPGETVTIKISDMPSPGGLTAVNFEDEDGFSADEWFTVTVVEKGLNATVKITADKETPLGEYYVEIVPINATKAIEVTLIVEESLSQVVIGNIAYLGGGIVMLAIGYVAGNAIKNKTAKRISKPLGILLYIGGAIAIAWFAYLAARVYI